MRPLLYSAAISLDGFIARPDGSHDWIPDEPAIDWGAFMARFDTVLVGRRTYEVGLATHGVSPVPPGMTGLLASRSADPADHPDLRVVGDDLLDVVAELRAGEGPMIWLLGGGLLARDLLAAGMVDRLELALVPVLLGEGLPLFAAGAPETGLTLRSSTTFPGGLLLAEYDVLRTDPDS